MSKNLCLIFLSNHFFHQLFVLTMLILINVMTKSEMFYRKNKKKNLKIVLPNI